jgi:glycosyltransferase involved in cell wall biosynthesis
MKIIFASYVVVPAFDTPAAWLSRINFYTGILEWLSKKNEVISIEQIHYKGEYLLNGVHYHFMDFGGKKTYFPRQQNRYIKRLQPDVVFIHGLHFPLQVIQLKLTLGPKVKIIAQHHAEPPAPGLRKYLQRMAGFCIDACLFTSEEMGLKWGNINKNKIRGVMEASSVFYPIDRQLARTKTGVRDGTVFLWVGRLDDNKDPLTVVRAFLQFSKEHADARLYMIYHTTPLLSAIESIRNDQVILVGQVPHEEMLYWFNSADFIVAGSHYEGSGIAVCEAMSCGCIPVITNIPAFRKLTGNGACGLLFDPGNEASLLAALKQLMTLNKEEMRNKTVAQFQKELSFEAIATQIQEICKQITA